MSKKPIRDMTEPELRAMCKGIAKWIENALPPREDGGPCLFFLAFTDTIGPGVAQYVSNVVRADGIKMLRETADRLEQREDVTR